MGRFASLPSFLFAAALVGSPALAVAAPAPPGASAQPAPSMADLLAAAPAGDWRPLDDAHTLYMELPVGRVVIELAPRMAPRAVAAIEALVRQGYFDGLTVDRAQDNFVAQWGDARGTRTLAPAQQRLAPEFTVPLRADGFTRLPDPDGYAPQAGFVDGFAAARDPRSGQGWLAHCYGAVGVGRDVEPDTGNGAELYAVIGHAPRQLDRNVTVVGRVRQGIELLATLPRGTAPLGFYADDQPRPPIASVRIAADLPEAQRTRLQVLRTDSATFARLVESRRNRRDEWYRQPAGYIDLCNVPLPVRPAP